MRTWITPVLFVALAAALATGQPPAKDAKDPPPIVIKPKNGNDPAPDPEPKAPSGVIVISQKGKTTDMPTRVLTHPGSPAATATPGVPVAGQPPAAPPAAPANPKDGTPLYDYWFLAAVDGQPIGYMHWEAREIEKKGQKFWIGTRYSTFTVKRINDVVTQWGEEATVETPDGDVLNTTVRQGLGPNQALVISGMVEGKTLKVTGQGVAAGAGNTPWPGGVTGVARQPRLFAQKKFKAGDTFDYLTYIGQVNRVVKVTVTFEGEEALALWPNTPPKKLLKFVERHEKFGGIKLPELTTWCDAETAEPLLSRFDLPMLGGEVTYLRTTKEAATMPVAKPRDIFAVQSLPLDREIPGIHTRGSVVYKMALPKDDEPNTAFASDFRQEVKNFDAKAKTFELHVSGSHGPVKGVAPQPAPGKEFLGSSYFINWDNPGVKGHAAKAVAGLPADASAWDKARAVERWVKAHMKAMEFSQAMATADEVAKTLSGDCTEFAMLGAAMCRVAGVPSRTVMGLVYANGKDGKAYLAYHMWFEVFADGQWLPLDATLGMGGVGPGHVKISDHSWHEERSIAPLLPLLRVLSARPRADVLRVN